MILKAVIIEDEYYAAQGLKYELESIEGIYVEAMYLDVNEFFENLDNIRPDVIFLDIELPVMNGFDLLDKLACIDNFNPSIIFTTAYDSYALKAFEYDADDYILKPVSRDRIIKSLNRVRKLNTVSSKGIEINCFKRLQIKSEGKEVNIGWRTKKAEELIAYLVSQEGEYVSKEKLADELWPDFDGTNAMSNLYLAFYYIKKQEKEFGFSLPIESSRGKMRINTDKVSCDFILFSGYIEKSKEVNTDKQIDLLEKAEEVYTGGFLQQMYYPWTVQLQQKYEIAYSRTVHSLVIYYSEKSDYEKVEYFKNRYKLKNI